MVFWHVSDSTVQQISRSKNVDEKTDKNPEVAHHTVAHISSDTIEFIFILRIF